MARTINLYPTSDITLGHGANTGNSGFSLIYDATDDGATTYIYHVLEQSSTNKTSQFTCAANSSDNPPSGKIRIVSVKVNTYWNLDTNVVQGPVSTPTIRSRTATLTPSVSFENGNYVNGTSQTVTTDQNNTFNSYISTFSNLSIVGQITTIDSLNAKLQIYTVGTYTAS